MSPHRLDPGTHLAAHVPTALADRLDTWRRRQKPTMNRGQAIADLLNSALADLLEE